MIKAVRHYQDYVRHDDPVVEASNFIALMVAASQPFYPLYVYWILGPDFWPTLFTLLSTPFFIAVPALARVNSLAGCALLPIVGIANTAMSAALLGPRSGVLLFLAPCIVIASLQFGRSERWLALIMAALALAAFWGLQPGAYASLVALSELEASRLVTLHAISVGTLLVVAGFSFARARSSR